MYEFSPTPDQERVLGRAGWRVLERGWFCAASNRLVSKSSKFSRYPNPTYLLRARGTGEGVLRRPPLGPVAPRAHDMAREFHLLERLHPSFSARA
jgi:hypothetical protein